MVHDFNILRAGRHPLEAQPPLFINAYVVLHVPSFLKAYSLFCDGVFQVTKNGRPIKYGQLAHDYRFYVDPLLDMPAIKQALRVFALEAQGHATYGNAALQ